MKRRKSRRGGRYLVLSALLASPASAQFQQPCPGCVVVACGAAGSTGAVTCTLSGAANKTTWICGFDVSSVGGTSVVSPVTVNNLVGSVTWTYQLPPTVAAGGVLHVNRTLTPCVPASGYNTSITVVTTADGTASAVDVNAWGFQQ